MKKILTIIERFDWSTIRSTLSYDEIKAVMWSWDKYIEVAPYTIIAVSSISLVQARISTVEDDEEIKIRKRELERIELSLLALE
jgi:hypothetical protein